MSDFSGSTAHDVAVFVAQKLVEDKWKNRFRELSDDNFNSDLPRDTSNGFALKSVIFEMGVPQEFTLSISSLQDSFQWRSLARVTKVDTMTNRLMELFELCGWDKNESIISPEEFSDNFYFDGSMGETLVVDCDGGDAELSFRDSKVWHLERGEELGYTPNVDPGAIRIAVAGGDAEINNRLVVDTDDDYIFFSYFLGGGITSRDEINSRIDQHWNRIGHILNQLDPGTFGSPYLFGLEGMSTPNDNSEGNN